MTNCETCHRKHEINNARLERANKRLFALVLILIFALLSTNFAWLMYEKQFDTVTETYEQIEQEADNGSNNYFAGENNYVS